MGCHCVGLEGCGTTYFTQVSPTTRYEEANERGAWGYKERERVREGEKTMYKCMWVVPVGGKMRLYFVFLRGECQGNKRRAIFNLEGSPKVIIVFKIVLIAFV